MNHSVSIIGAGRVGRTLGKCLRDLGWRIGAVVTRSERTSRAAVRAIGAGTPFSAISPESFYAPTILVTTPDDLLAPTAAALAHIGGRSGCRGKVVLHTSGALDRTVLKPLARLGAATGSLHPMQTFSGCNVPKLEGTIFAVEGDPQARQVARLIARSLGGVAIDIDRRNKAAYHASAILVAGNALGLVEAATQVLIKAGFPRRRALQTLLPLMRQVIDNFERLGPRQSWTGPVARGDYSVVARHMKALADYPPEFRQAYATLARLSVRVLSAKPNAQLMQLGSALKKFRGGKS
jgi:predicted short-subunit dehydrogenase-like oxidoreductase (DUF2520 family)